MYRPSPLFVTAALAPILVLGAGLGGCGDRADGRNGDAGADGAGYDAGPTADTIAPLTLDFTATGCQAFDPAASRCSGPAPLTVQLTPIGSPSLTRFLWDFGDGTPTSMDRSPTHTYTLPGAYSISLVGDGVTGSLSRMRSQFAAVAAVSVGRLCDVDAQCATGLRCLCGSAAGCGGGFPRGVCTVDCDAGTCTGGAACADLTLAVPGAASPTLPYQRPLCLAPCDSDQACAAGFACRNLPGADTGGPRTWVRACFAPVPRDVGTSCRGPDGLRADAACAGGLCADLGALGLCTASCSAAGGCPPGTACAEFGDHRTLCLATCPTAGAPCGDDPLLSCQASGSSSGALAFTLLGIGPSLACGPRPCASDDDCQPAGACGDGHCLAPGEPVADD